MSTGVCASRAGAPCCVENRDRRCSWTTPRRPAVPGSDQRARSARSHQTARCKQVGRSRIASAQRGSAVRPASSEASDWCSGMHAPRLRRFCGSPTQARAGNSRTRSPSTSLPGWQLWCRNRGSTSLASTGCLRQTANTVGGRRWPGGQGRSAVDELVKGAAAYTGFVDDAAHAPIVTVFTVAEVTAELDVLRLEYRAGAVAGQVVDAAQVALADVELHVHALQGLVEVLV